MRALASILSGLLFAAAFSPLDHAWLAWIASVPWLLAVGSGSRVHSAALCGAVFALSTVLAIVSWVPAAVIHGFSASRIGAGGVWLALGLSAVPATAVFAAVLSRVGITSPWFVPCAGFGWAMVELSWEFVFPRIPWTSLGATQIDFPFAMAGSVVGVHGVSGLVLAAGATIAQLVAPHRRRAAMAWAAVIGLTLFTVSRLEHDPGTVGTNVRVAAVQPGLPMSERASDRFERRTLDALLAESAAAGSADLVVWPESSLLSQPRGETLERIRAYTESRGVYLIAGGRRRVGPHWETVAFVFDPGGTASAPYVKRHLLPLAEDVPSWLAPGLRRSLGRLAPSIPMRAGARSPVISVAEHRLEISICFEAAYQSDAYQNHTLDPRGGLVNLVNDGWYDAGAGAEQHLMLARWRAIESGQTLVRAAATGITAIVSPEGHLVAALPVGVRGSVEAVIPTARVTTLFERYGNTPLVLTALLAFAAGLTRRTRRVA